MKLQCAPVLLRPGLDVLLAHLDLCLGGDEGWVHLARPKVSEADWDRSESLTSRSVARSGCVHISRASAMCHTRKSWRGASVAPGGECQLAELYLRGEWGAYHVLGSPCSSPVCHEPQHKTAPDRGDEVDVGGHNQLRVDRDTIS